jgi:hypothetical protein
MFNSFQTVFNDFQTVFDDLPDGRDLSDIRVPSRARQSLACSNGRSLAVFSGVQPGGSSTAAQPLATSAT